MGHPSGATQNLLGWRHLLGSGPGWRAACAGALAIGGLYLVPAWLFAVLVIPVFLVPTVACLRCSLRSRSRDRSTYAWLAGAFVLLGIGYQILAIREAVGVTVADPNPDLTDAFFLAAYASLIVGFVVLVCTRYGLRDSDGWIDTGIIVAAATVALWFLVIVPVANDRSLPTAARLVDLAYPITITVIAAFALRIACAPGHSRPSDRLILLAALCGMASDVSESAYGVGSGQSLAPVLRVPAAAACALVALAACHPSARRADPVATRDRPGASRRRLIVLSGAMLVPPAAMVVALRRHAYASLPVLIGASVVMCGLVVTRLLLAVARSAASALEDPLAGVLNRRGAEAAIQRALDAAAHGGAFAVLFVDLDGFKAVNDQHGHAWGDRVLARVGDRLTRAARAGDVVARIGGDEFVVVLNELPASPPEARALVGAIGTRLLAAVSAPIDLGRCDVTISASIGAVVADTDRARRAAPVDVLVEADNAMYAAKHAGRHQLTIVDFGAGPICPAEVEAAATR